MIRREIGRIRNDQDFDHADANLAQISDAQTGKVFTEITPDDNCAVVVQNNDWVTDKTIFID